MICTNLQRAYKRLYVGLVKSFFLHFLAFSSVFSACKAPKRWLTAGEYSHGLHLSTRNDGTFYAWRAGDNVQHDSLNIAFLCVSHFPKANIVAWLPPNQNLCVFGVLTHVGTDSFRIQLSKPIGNAYFTQQLAQSEGLLFGLEKARDTWHNFYFWQADKPAFLYKKPDFKSEHIEVSPKTHLYSSKIVGEWSEIVTDSCNYWVHSTAIY